MFTIRAPFAALAGAVVAVALFLGLAQLIRVPFETQPFATGQRINFTPQIPTTAPITRRPPKPEPEPVVREPDRPTIGLPREGDPVDANVFARPQLHARPKVHDLGTSMSGVDNDAIPRVRLEPVYPPHALARGTEGWVEVRFTVTAIGTVRDAVVVESEPGTTFDEAALKAIAGWRYNPRVENGEAVERVGLRTVIRFEVEN